ncbi:MAG TPA: double zinc ribbon domain-containing protein, partial [Alphaproteobacteria bacterium]|nr:double zinc ribbon domain-containing protein [Alphaproteobacteria bacterium]
MALKNLSTAIKTLVDLVLPPRCPVSGDVVERQGMLSAESWAAMEFIASPLCDVCGIPFEYDTEEAVCAACLATPPYYARARAA